MTLECLKIEPDHPAIGSVIWLHGLGADGHDFVDLVPQLKFRTELPLRFIFPHAPIRPVTLNANMEMRAWFDVHDLGENTIASGGESITKDEAGIKASQQAIERLIEDEIAAGIPSEKIILAGFSQGGSIALYTGLHYDKPLAGLMGLSTCLPSEEAIRAHHSANAKTPILLAHGSFDPVLPLALAELTFDRLKQANLRVEFRKYPMDHQLCQEEVEDIASWMKALLITPP